MQCRSTCRLWTTATRRRSKRFLRWPRQRARSPCQRPMCARACSALARSRSLARPRRSRLTLSLFRQELLVRDGSRHAPALAAGTTLPKRTGGTEGKVGGKWTTPPSEHACSVGTADRLLLPVQDEGGLREVSAVAHQPGLEVDLGVGQAIEQGCSSGSSDGKLIENDLLEARGWPGCPRRSVRLLLAVLLGHRRGLAFALIVVAVDRHVVLW